VYLTRNYFLGYRNTENATVTITAGFHYIMYILRDKIQEMLLWSLLAIRE